VLARLGAPRNDEPNIGGKIDSDCVENVLMQSRRKIRTKQVLNDLSSPNKAQDGSRVD
jgi:hypothetical protein